jgi:hypothetical protein
LPPGWNGPHTANQNRGDLYPYDTTMICTVYLEMPEEKKIAKMLIEKYIKLRKKFYTPHPKHWAGQFTYYSLDLT